jgi:pimeloyl-ACP methyl ester carboxylesterase
MSIHLRLRRPLRRRAALTTAVLAATAVCVFPATAAAAPKQAGAKPTVVLVHGAFADASGWNGVINRLEAKGYETVAPANPLRGVASDAAYLKAVLASIPGPITLVGHSYGGVSITNAAVGNPNVTSLVYVSAFAPDAGDSVGSLGQRVPGGQVGEQTLHVSTFPTPTGESAPEGTLKKHLFHRLFAADLPRTLTSAMAAAQRPAALQTLGEPSGPPAWKSIRSYFLVSGKDHVIGTKLLRFMAKRAGGVTVEARTASHAVMVSQPGLTADLILRAARRR